MPAYGYSSADLRQLSNTGFDPHTQFNLGHFCDVLTEEYHHLFATDPDYAYAASKTTPGELARKMTLGLDNGTASKDGAGIRRTCKRIGISPTYKAIRAYLKAQ